MTEKKSIRDYPKGVVIAATVVVLTGIFVAAGLVLAGVGFLIQAVFGG